MNPYLKLQQRKRKWTPVQTTAGKVREGSEEAIYRALALRHMELPVGDFIQDALANDVPEMARELLLSNVKDEEERNQYVENILGFGGRGQFERHAQRHGEGIINDEHRKHAVPQPAVGIVGVKNGWPDHRAERFYIVVWGLFPARTRSVTGTQCFCRRCRKPWPVVAPEVIPCGQHGPFRQHANAMALGERRPNVPALFSPLATTNTGCHNFRAFTVDRFHIPHVAPSSSVPGRSL